MAYDKADEISDEPQLSSIFGEALTTQNRTQRVLNLASLKPPTEKSRPSSRLVAMYCLWKDDDWIAASLASVYPYCKKIVCLLNRHSWTGDQFYDVATEQIVRAFPDPDHKIVVVTGDWDDPEWGGQLKQRSIGFEWCDEGDWLWLIDGDEVYQQGLIYDIEKWVENPLYDCGRVPCVSFWQDPYTVGWTEHMARLFRYHKESHFIAPNNATPCAKTAVVGSDYAFLHMGYVRSDARIREKMQIYEERSHRGDFHKDFDARRWLDNVWTKHRTEPQTSVHPIPEKYKSRVRPYWGEYPQELTGHPYMWLPGLVSVITVTHNSNRPLAALIDSWKEYDPGVNCEWIFVDSGSRPDQRKGLNSLLPFVVLSPMAGSGQRRTLTQLHTIGENVKFTASVNLGIEHARGEYILLLNPDIVLLKRDWLRRMIEDMHSVPGGVICGSKQLYPDGTINHAGGAYKPDGTPTHRGCDVHQRIGEQDLGQYDQVATMPWVTGSCFLFHRRLFIAEGYLDQVGNPHYNSDRDYCIRARKAGFQVVYSPTPMVHLHGRSCE